MANFLVGLLIYLFPKETVAKILLVLLGKVAEWTSNTIDDKLVATIAASLEDKHE